MPCPFQENRSKGLRGPCFSGEQGKKSGFLAVRWPRGQFEGPELRLRIEIKAIFCPFEAGGGRVFALASLFSKTTACAGVSPRLRRRLLFFKILV